MPDPDSAILGKWAFPQKIKGKNNENISYPKPRPSRYGHYTYHPFGCAFVNVPLVSRLQPLEEKVVDGEGEAKILLLDVTGTISKKSGGFPGFLRRRP